MQLHVIIISTILFSNHDGLHELHLRESLLSSALLLSKGSPPGLLFPFPMPCFLSRGLLFLLKSIVFPWGTCTLWTVFFVVNLTVRTRRAVGDDDPYRHWCHSFPYHQNCCCPKEDITVHVEKRVKSKHGPPTRPGRDAKKQHQKKKKKNKGRGEE